MTQTTKLNSGFRLGLFAGLAVGALATAAAAQAQATHSIHIPSGPLDAALITLADQTHEQLLYTPRLVAGRTSPAVDGELTAEQALARMIHSNDIVVRRTGPSIVVLRPAAAAAATTVGLQTDPPPPGAATNHPFVAEGGTPPSDLRLPQAASSTPAAPTVSEIEVTGSHIRGAQTVSPLIVLTQEDLIRTGQTTLADALRALPENFGGGAGEGAVNTGADKLARNATFGSALNLRGLGNNATLVLINGHRMAGSGTFGDFSDISTIPTAAVERVEVLLDGASALYGSDAVGGVVNIIMRRNFDGAETRLEGGVGTAGQPGEEQVAQTFGKRWTGGGVLLSYELQHRDALAGADRPFAATSDLRALGGPDLRSFNAFPGNILAINPATNALVPSFAIPRGQTGVGLLPSQLQAGVVNLQNQRLGEDILPQQTLNSVYVSADQDIGERLQILGNLRYSDRRFSSVQAPAIGNLTVTRANPFFVAPSAATNSETIAYSFAGDMPNPVNSGSTKALGMTLEGDLRLAGDWRGQLYGTFAQEDEVSNNANLINSLALNEALGTSADNPATPFSTAANGFFNPFTGVPGSNNPTVLHYIDGGFLNLKSRDRVSSVNLQADGSLWSLPAGAVKLAVGAQFRHESLDRTQSLLVASVTPSTVAPPEVSRDVSAVFGEAQIPLFGPDNARPGLERLDLSLAGRVEHYETFGTTADPKVGVIWGPTSDLQIRATYGTSFRAPALRESSDPASDSPQLLNLGTGKLEVLTLSGGNPNLRPETATSYTLGADWRPKAIPGLNASFSAFDINYHNRIAQPVSTNLLNALQDPTLSSFVTRITPATNAADLAKITALLNSPAFNTLSGVFAPTAFGAIVDNRYVNTAKLHVQGLDLTGAYAFDLGADRVQIAENATYMLRYDLQSTPTSPLIDQVNTVNFPERFRSRLTADWTRGRLTLGGAFNYVGAYHDALGVHIGDQPTFDLQARLAPPDSGPLRGLSVILNVRNVFDRDPPFYANPFGIAYDAANADPVGRFVSIQLTRLW